MTYWAGRVLRALLYQSVWSIYPPEYWDEWYTKDVQFNPPATNLASVLAAFEADVAPELFDEAASGNCAIEVATPYLHLPEFSDPWQFWGIDDSAAQKEYPFWVPICVYLCKYHFPHSEEYYPECDYRHWVREGYAVDVESMRYYPLLLKGSRAEWWSGLYNHLLSLAFEMPFDDYSKSDLPHTYVPPHWADQFPDNEVQLTDAMGKWDGGTTVAQWGACAKCKPYPHIDSAELISKAGCVGASVAPTLGGRLRERADCANAILNALIDQLPPENTNFHSRLEGILNSDLCAEGHLVRYGPTPDQPYFNLPSDPAEPAGWNWHWSDEFLAALSTGIPGGPWDGWVMVAFRVELPTSQGGTVVHGLGYPVVFKGGGVRQCCNTINMMMDWLWFAGAASFKDKVQVAAGSQPSKYLSLAWVYNVWFRFDNTNALVQCQPNSETDTEPDPGGALTDPAQCTTYANKCGPSVDDIFEHMVNLLLVIVRNFNTNLGCWMDDNGLDQPDDVIWVFPSRFVGGFKRTPDVCAAEKATQMEDCANPTEPPWTNYLCIPVCLTNSKDDKCPAPPAFTLVVNPAAVECASAYNGLMAQLGKGDGGNAPYKPGGLDKTWEKWKKEQAQSVKRSGLAS